MGLTVHFELAAPAGCDAAQAKHLVASARQVATLFQRQGRVDKAFPVASDTKTLGQLGRQWIFPPWPGEKRTFANVEVFPTEGFLFGVRVGADCEPLWMGLCRYPRQVWSLGHEFPTKLGTGWRFAGCSKTQYAGLHGWEHFLRCHCAVVDLLAAWRTLGVRVKISDEGDYWPRRSITALRENLGQMNCAIAGAAGALKDLDETLGGQASRVESPIFQHRDFERLEARGASANAGLRRAAAKIIREARG